MITLSVTPGADDVFTQRFVLDAVEVSLTFRWLPRPFAWYVSAALADGTAVCDTFRVTPGSALLPDATFPGLPPGKLFVTGPDPYPRDALGAQVVVLYADAAEVAESEGLALL